MQDELGTCKAFEILLLMLSSVAYAGPFPSVYPGLVAPEVGVSISWGPDLAVM